MTNPIFAHLRDLDDDEPAVGGLMDDLLGVEQAVEIEVNESETITAMVEAARALTSNWDWTLDLDDEAAALLDASVDSARTKEYA